MKMFIFEGNSWNLPEIYKHQAMPDIAIYFSLGIRKLIDNDFERSLYKSQECFVCTLCDNA
jgi:hypothetical protein